jgi:uncharacterized membrane protein
MEDYSYQERATTPTSGLAIASLVSSILGLTLIPTIGSIIGLVLGYMARQQIEESMGRQSGEGVAKAGIILGWIGVGLAVLGVCLVILSFLLFGMWFVEVG